MGDVLLEVSGLKKSFGGVAALWDGRFRLERGSVHALCGGNGAGKSTFLTIVMGIQQRDAGTIRRNGREVHFASPGEALENGISIIEQELSPVPAMTVAENIFLGREPLRAFGRVDFRSMNARAKELLDQLGFDIPPTALMMDLSVAKLQLVEIAKALSYDAEVIIMDEPTSALGESEADHLFAAIRRLKAQGKGVIYVSHRLSEIFDIADSYTVFRDGAYVADGAIGDVGKGDLIRMIVGRPLTEEFVKENRPTDEIALAVSGIDGRNGVRDVSFEARRGEILAFYGLMGSGRTEIFERLFGLSAHRAGTVRLDGEDLRVRAPADAIAKGLAFVTEDRKESGLVLLASVRNNLCMASLPALSRGVNMSVAAEKRAAQRMIDLFGVKTSGDQLEVSGLSGGNQQKVVLGKWFMTDPKVLLLDEPTRGVDVGAKREIYRIMSDFAAAGGTVLMISSETDEVLGMADRVIVMKDGRIAGELSRAAMTAEELVHLAA
ncbi:sugar ABC transporter ATP-binding protein [Histidinibacterium lentulum]|uniref:Sugar ABC transporter ATP-binding protein n=1 Tax=Histidinibacterium lentulum TaxID=2480588 RepID=A0A3N2R6H1_9RHOB|nr:sugar ABC transporter ATP-binding protein [Histidinibacterium lentulum]ROU02936.1 sugar ABC transporter ATP-binding protein [Histidinibacterium lentulum]